MRRAQHESLQLQLAIAAVVLLSLNTVLLVVVLLHQGSGAVVTEQGSRPPAVAPAMDPIDAAAFLSSTGGDTFESFLQATSGPLRIAFQNAGLDGAALPTEEEMQEAIIGGGFGTPAAELVLGKLRVGYARVGLTFPELGTGSARSGAEASGRSGTPSGTLPGQAGTSQAGRTGGR